jgi:hypothetical protein
MSDSPTGTLSDTPVEHDPQQFADYWKRGIILPVFESQPGPALLHNDPDRIREHFEDGHPQ